MSELMTLHPSKFHIPLSNHPVLSRASASHSTNSCHSTSTLSTYAKRFHIRALRHVRESLPDDVAATVACSIISSRLDYCNSLFTGMSAANFAKLQNTLARVLQRRSKHDHITPALIQLHWLPIQQRVTYKLATI